MTINPREEAYMPATGGSVCTWARGLMGLGGVRNNSKHFYGHSIYPSVGWECVWTGTSLPTNRPVGVGVKEGLLCKFQRYTLHVDLLTIKWWKSSTRIQQTGVLVVADVSPDSGDFIFISSWQRFGVHPLRFSCVGSIERIGT